MKTRLNSELVHLYAAAVVAAVRNRLHSQMALREGKPVLSRLLSALESSESAHARRFLMYLRGKADKNETFLDDYLKNKKTEIAPCYAALARSYALAGEPGKAENFQQFERVVAAQVDLLAHYRTEKEDMPNDVYVCQICGFLSTAPPSTNCPVCNAVQEKFERFSTL
jgi:rubrerythrin